jgi:hypothetical protein
MYDSIEVGTSGLNTLHARLCVLLPPSPAFSLRTAANLVAPLSTGSYACQIISMEVAQAEHMRENEPQS